MSAAAAVGIAIGHDMQPAFFQQYARVRIAKVGEHIQRTFHPIFGLRFARMLARVQPDLRFAIPHRQAINGLPLKAVAQAPVANAFACCGVRNQIMVPFHAKGREIGEPDDVAGGRVANGKGAAVRSFVIARIGAAPKITVFRNAGAIIWPTAGIGAAFQPRYAQFNFFTRCTRNAEVEPLRKLRILILANAKGGAVAIDGVH